MAGIADLALEPAGHKGSGVGVFGFFSADETSDRSGGRVLKNIGEFVFKQPLNGVSAHSVYGHVGVEQDSHYTH